MMNASWEKVREFHRKFGHPVSNHPVRLSDARVDARYKWMLEEIDEVLASDNIYDQADAMIDLIYFALGTLVEMGVPPDSVFEIVHRANMAKLWEDGRPHYNEDGKTIKPCAWKDPFEEIKADIDSLTCGI